MNLMFFRYLTLYKKTKYFTFPVKNIADAEINVTEKLTFVPGSTENDVGNGKYAGFQQFLLWPKYFQNLSSPNWQCH